MRLVVRRRLQCALGASKKARGSFQILLHTADGFGRGGLPRALPLTELREGVRFVIGQVDPFGFVETGALGGFELVLQVSQFVSPATLVCNGGPQPAQSADQTSLSVGNNPFQELPLPTAAPPIPQEVMPTGFPLGFNDQKVAEFLARAALKRGRGR